MVSSIYTESGVNGEPMHVMLPKYWRANGTKPGIVFAHGYNGTALENAMPDLPQLNLYRVMLAIVRAGYPVLSGFFGGNQWGNAQAVSKVNTAVSYLASQYGASSTKVGLFGESMGHLSVMNWAAQNKSKVGAVVSSIGVADLANIYSLGGHTASINAAYGKAYTDSEFGALYNPSVNTATKYSGIPWLGWAGTSDTTCPPARTQALAASIGSSATLNMMQGGTHSWDTISMVSPQVTADFFRTNLG